MKNLVTKKIAILSAICVSLIISLTANGQAPGSSRGLASSDGINMIQGRVHFPSGQTVDSKTVRVTLESISAFGSMSTVTDQDGSFRFRSLQAGSYTIVVDAGKDYELTRETVNIDREASPGGRTIQVSIQLRLKFDPAGAAFANVPPEALSNYEKGIAAAKKKDSKNAVEFLNKAVSIYPSFALALNELGNQYMLQKDMEKAGKAYESLSKLKPFDTAAHLNLGIALFNQKKLEEAENALRQALKLNASGPTVHYYLGLTLISLKRYGESEKELELAIANGGENLALAHKYLGGLYMSSKKNSQAADELEKYLKLDPKAADAERIKDTIKGLRNKQ